MLKQLHNDQGPNWIFRNPARYVYFAFTLTSKMLRGIAFDSHGRQYTSVKVVSPALTALYINVMLPPLPTHPGFSLLNLALFTYFNLLTSRSLASHV
jgi:hypothetical protein